MPQGREAFARKTCSISSVIFGRQGGPARTRGVSESQLWTRTLDTAVQWEVCNAAWVKYDIDFTCSTEQSLWWSNLSAERN